MIELAAELGIDVEVVERSLRVSRSYGEVYRRRAAGRESDRDHVMSATAFRRAGAHAVLMGKGPLAHELFRAATEQYMAAQHPYAALIGNLTTDSIPSITEHERRDSIEGAFLIWSVGNLTVDLLGGRQAEEELVSSYGSQRVGTLGFPVRLLLELRDSAFAWLDGADERRLLRPLGQFLRYFDEGLERARLSGRHWRRLAMRFHPAEPDVLAVLVALDRVLAIGNESVSGFVPRIETRPETVELLRRALPIWSAWAPGDETNNR